MDSPQIFDRRQFVIKSMAAGTAALLVTGKNRPAKAQQSIAWTDLFDGTTLDGWHKNPKKIGHGTGGDWYVEDGAITGEQDPPGSGNGGILLTDKKFLDFELMIDMKPDWGVCSGLFLRGNDTGQCLQMMVDYHDGGNVGHIYGEGTGGFNTRAFDIDGVYGDDERLIGLKTSKHRELKDTGLVSSCAPDDWLAAWKVNDWNTAKVRVEGGKFPRVTTWINGTKVCEFDGENSDNQGYKKQEVAKVTGQAGSVAVQVHGGGGWPKGAKCRWRNVRIRELA
jgi:hypothetical protein